MTPSSTADAAHSGEAALTFLAVAVPYIGFLGIGFELRGGKMTASMKSDTRLVGSPFTRSLHGGAIAAFLEVAAQIELARRKDLIAVSPQADKPAIRLPKTISFSVDYLRPGLPEEAFAAAAVTRSGRRFASVHVEGWQGDRGRLFAQATGHFLLPGAYE